MSRSQQTTQNPAQHFMEWAGGKGELRFYSKEKETNVTVPLPFTFMVLDELSTITGWSDEDQSGIWSNEVRSTRSDDLHVRTKKGTKIVGLYQDIRGKFGKYTKSVYIAHKTSKGDYIIGNIKLTGAALNAWIDFSGKHKVQSGTVTITGAEEGKKGSVTFQTPVFEYRDSTEEENAIAETLDTELQEYLKEYLKSNATSTDKVAPMDRDDPTGMATEEQIADYEARRQNNLNKPYGDTETTDDDFFKSLGL